MDDRRVPAQPPRPPDPRDPGRLRISDDERHQVAEVLRRAAGEGRIDLDELEERLEATYRARTYAELVPITGDLPAPVSGTPAAPTAPAHGGAPGPLAHYGSSVAVMSQARRAGRWRLEEGHTAFALMGSVLLDLRDAEIAGGDVTVNASAVMGEVEVVVDAGTTVVVDGTGIMGEYAEQRPEVAFDLGRGGPVVRLRGIALMGSVHVRRRGAPGERGRGRLGSSDE